MSDVKQVKVDNWGIYFLQRLKHFFNRTDYCDLTLQFQDNAQLKVHRLVLNACTEYFELLERTCEMYEDCLVMPEDLQADVVVPIVNFMYTGQLEFRMDALERLYQTSQIMNMPVLSKLLEAHRGHQIKNFGSVRKYAKGTEVSKHSKYPSSNTLSSGKRSYTKAFENSKAVSNSKSPDPRHSSVKSKSSKEVIVYRDKKLYLPQNKPSPKPNDSTAYRPPSPIPLDSSLYNKKLVLGDPRPTRYELPEELDTDNVFDNSFTNISYTSQPLMIHPDSTKQYSGKKGHVFNEPTSSKKSFVNTTVDIVECKKISSKTDIFDDELVPNVPDDDFQPAYLSRKDISPKDPGQLFDQIIDNEEGPKVTIESKDKQASNLDHAKIISEVLKKYPHLVKSNKNIKLKILNTPAKVKKPRAPSVQLEPIKKKEIKEELAYTYETDVLDSKEAAKLISMGAENIKGPWICLICGTPGRALNFTSYYNFRRHLVEVHKEKPVSTICEHCGLKSYKRNYLLHHIYTKHGVPPPPQYHFPKCPTCDYIALTEGFLVKHKLTHSEVKVARCTVCSTGFTSTNQLLLHIQKTGHKQQIVMCDKKPSIQCSYCMKVFLRDNNFYCHLKTSHKEQALRDGLIEESDDEEKLEGRHRVQDVKPNIKHEHSTFDNELEEEEEDEDEAEYKIHKRLEVNTSDAKKSRIANQNVNQKILNSRLNTSLTKHVQKPKMVSDMSNEFMQEINSPTQIHEENIVVINDIEYVMKDNQLIPRKPTMNQESNEEYILSDYMHSDENDQRLQNLETVAPTTSIDIANMHSTEMVQQPKMILKKSASLNQPIQIVVSNEEEYKALMASNHSIIFDDGNANKTLTVLTAPQSSTLDNAGIELDNTQANDMMIIQEDYPMNVSQAVSGDSKYVVVYSHAMEHNDPNKQYQIITPDMETQYVQNSAVLTQNYNTITTSTSMVNTNVMDTQIVETWPQSDHLNVNNQTTILVPPETELQTITEAGQANLKQKVDENSLIDLPEAQILHIPAKSTLVQLDPMQSNIDQSHALSLEAITNISPEQMVADENQPNSVEESMSIEVPSEAVNDKENVIVHETQITTENEIEEECQSMDIENIVEESPEVCLQTHIDSSLTAQEQPEETLISQELVQSISVQETSDMPSSIEHSEVVSEVSEQLNSDTGENINTENIDKTNIIQDTPLENPAGEAVPMNSENVKSTIIVETKEQIESLASEWSEDEYDAIPQEADAHVDKISSENAVTEEPELEESIENIQQEVQKQICDEDNSDVTTDVESFASQKVAANNLDEPTKSNTVIVNAEATQEKISSLLNDWEDNDSQEDNSSVNENGEDNVATIETIDENAAANTESNDTIQVSKDEAKKDDKIKSLVSDWDDDDEDRES